jgi:murein DD-endopeptidase MepM/ murein hydrolase activator NlpD
MMLGRGALWALAMITILVPAALTPASAVMEPSASGELPGSGVPLDAALAYSTPHPTVPSPTGVLPSSSTRASSVSNESWVALRSPNREVSSESLVSKRRGRSSAGLTHWKGSNTRGRTLSDLELRVAQLGVTDWVYPIDEELIAGSPFGNRRHPILNVVRSHLGQDIGCRRGTPVHSVADGVVTYSQGSRSAGRYIEVEHSTFEGRAVKSRYLHLNRRLVRKGENVRMGQVIGHCGSSGISTSPHLHFEVWLGSVARRPFRVYGQVVRAEADEKSRWDDAIAQAIEDDRLKELLEVPGVPYEVRQVVEKYWSSGGQRLIERLGPGTPERRASVR